MTIRWRWRIGGLMAVALLVAAPQGGQESEQQGLDTARQAARAMTSELLAAMMQAVNSGGPEAAVRVCREVAPEIAARHAQDGVVVRRVSTRTRNPANRPDPWEDGALTRLLEAHGAGSAEDLVEVVATGESRVLRLMRPITVGAVCLQCHGERSGLAPEVRAVLAEHYPEDRAVGYAPGDFRGAVSVTVGLTSGSGTP